MSRVGDARDGGRTEAAGKSTEAARTGLSDGEAHGLAQEALAVDDNAAAGVAEGLASNAAPADTLESPGLLESAATWAGETAKGYATGAVNEVLGLANLVNEGANAALSAVGVDYRFETDMRVEPTTETERHAQNAMGVAAIATGVAGAVRAAPSAARLMDDAVEAVQGRLRGSRSPDAGPVAAPAAAATAARLGDLRPEEIARIQAAADELGADLYVVGSAAKGTRRNVDTDLPLAEFGGTKANTRSDIDYVTSPLYDDAADALDLPDLDSSWGVRGVDYITLDKGPVIRFRPDAAPEVIEGTGRLMLH